MMVAFWAPQAEESIAVISELEKLADEREDVNLVKIDTYRNQRTAKRYGVEEIPSVLFFNKGKVVASISGRFSREDVMKRLDFVNK